MVVTRFAPSPTGYLHIGSVRTALFSYLYAKRHQGKFLLRIEDTDRERSTEEAVQVILDGLAWLGLDADEPAIYQTQRFARYQQVIDTLLEKGQAYRCYCSKERLEALRATQLENKQKPRYDGHCRHHPGEQTGAYVIRFKTPETGCVTFQDAVKGPITIANEELDDLVIQRSDATPTYNFCVVIDDIETGVTHVIRGDDHINNTPKQIHLYHALGKPLPVFAHLPMILGEDAKKLSKRHGAVSVLECRESGFLPQALLNALVRLGWSSGDKEIFSLSEMIELFDLSAVNQAAACFSYDKLRWLNQHYLKTLPYEELKPHLDYHFEKLGISRISGPSTEALIPLFAPRSHTLIEFCQSCQFFFQPVSQYDEEAVEKHVTQETIRHLQELLAIFSTCSSWEAEKIHQSLKDYVAEHQLKFPQLAQPIRIALTGTIQSPAIDQTLAIMGQVEVISRLRRAISYFKDRLDR
jgi:glutamyl-tRNA synthetase